MSRPSVLVTGGAGYIGSHAVKALRQQGGHVIVFDNFSAGHREAVANASATIEGDIHDVAALRTAIRQHHIDAVMHFAAWLSVGESVRNPAGYYENNVVGALRVLDAMVAEGVEHLVFSSTAAVFGDPVETPITELHPKRPINAYGETKLAVERALTHYERAYGLRSIALRYFNAAGADPDGELGEDHAPEAHVIPRAIDAALGRGSFEVFGEDYETPDGTCLRDYVHVTDLAAAHLLALDALRGGANDEPFPPVGRIDLRIVEALEVQVRARGLARFAGRHDHLRAGHDVVYFEHPHQLVRIFRAHPRRLFALATGAMSGIACISTFAGDVPCAPEAPAPVARGPGSREARRRSATRSWSSRRR